MYLSVHHKPKNVGEPLESEKEGTMDYSPEPLEERALPTILNF